MKVLKKSKAFYDVFERKPGAEKEGTHYCPGCGHGIVHKLIAEALEDLDMYKKTTFISPVGCSVFAYYYFNTGNIQAAHGRAPAVGTAVKRAHPDSYVISYQGDGDLAAIGTAEIIHAANRGENITVFFINNAIYGMTGGQMAPTSLINQKTATSPYGRNVANDGMPLKMAEIISSLDTPVLVCRSSTHNIKNIMNTKKFIRQALEVQKDNKGFSFIEILSQCPTQWKVPTNKANTWMEDNLLPYYKLGIFKDIREERTPQVIERPEISLSEIKSKLGLREHSITVLTSEKLKIEQEITIKIAGFGGQGVLSLGIFLGELAMNSGYNSTWIPSYGPEMRGGTANCSVVLSNKHIGNPAFLKYDILIAMNTPSLEKFAKNIKNNGILLYNNSIINKIPKEIQDIINKNNITAISVSASQIAEDAGSIKTANIVMLGCLIKERNYFNHESVFQLISEKFINNQALIEINKKAYKSGTES